MNNKTAILKGLIEKMVSNEVKKQLPILLEELLTNPSNNTSIPKPVELTSRTSTLKEILEDKDMMAQLKESERNMKKGKMWELKY